MRRIMNRIASFFRSILLRIKTATKEPLEFLHQGRFGGMALCALLAAQFLYGCFFNTASCLVPAPILIFLLFGLVILLTELVILVFKLIFGGVKRSRVYFLLAWMGLSTAFMIGTQLQSILSGILIGFFMASAVDLFGSCVLAFLRTRKFKQVFGYVTLLTSASLIALFALFFHLDTFGESRITQYLAVDSEYDEKEIPGFDQYLADGTHKVSVLDYGPDDPFDIVTECVDLSNLAERTGFVGWVQDHYFDHTLENAPVAGRIWYPEGLTDRPILFIVHGNHDFTVPSYLGYDYLGEYLASNGYVVVSVDENILNSLGDENDARAILLLENMKAILNENAKAGSPLCGRIDTDKIAIAGHSRGGEMVATAYLFNDLEVYPDNGSIALDYHFNISSIIAIAPTADQYMPAEHAVRVKDVNYLLIHGANDQDVSLVMGEKQYHNVRFTEGSEEQHLKSYVYVMGANHGQFNTAWGRYDGIPGTNGFLNTHNFLSDTEQQLIAKAYIRTFLDKTLLEQNDYAALLNDHREYAGHLPKTVYVTNYMDSDFERFCSFDTDADIAHGATEDVKIRCIGMKEWKERADVYGSGADGENYVLDCSWEESDQPRIEITFPAADLSKGSLSFRIADMREDAAEDVSEPEYLVELHDAHGHTVSIANPRPLYPTLAVQLYKQDVFFNSYEHKHPMQTVRIHAEMFREQDFDDTCVVKMVLILTGSESGQIILDDVGYDPVR